MEWKTLFMSLLDWKRFWNVFSIREPFAIAGNGLPLELILHARKLEIGLLETFAYRISVGIFLLNTPSYSELDVRCSRNPLWNKAIMNNDSRLFKKLEISFQTGFSWTLHWTWRVHGGIAAFKRTHSLVTEKHVNA